MAGLRGWPLPRCDMAVFCFFLLLWGLGTAGGLVAGALLDVSRAALYCAARFCRYVGDMLWLDRTLSVGTAAGTLALAFRVAAVTYRRGTSARNLRACGMMLSLSANAVTWLYPASPTKIARGICFTMA